MVNKTPYILGVDVGVASLGLALINANDSSDIISGIVRTYRIPEGAAESLQAKTNGNAAQMTVAETPALKEATHEIIKNTKVKS